MDYQHIGLQYTQRQTALLQRAKAKQNKRLGVAIVAFVSISDKLCMKTVAHNVLYRIL